MGFGRRLAASATRTLCVGACGALLLAGCGGGGEGARLQGSVTLGGKPIPDDAKAFVMFTATAKVDGKAASASAPIVGGKYDCPNVPTGPVRVGFDITREVGPVKKSERTGADYRDVENLVPATAATGLELTVDGDKADQNFEL